jgi:hypothetical protein
MHDDGVEFVVVVGGVILMQEFVTGKPAGKRIREWFPYRYCRWCVRAYDYDFSAVLWLVGD